MALAQLGEQEGRGTLPVPPPPPPEPAGEQRTRPVLSWIAAGGALVVAVLLLRTLAAYPLLPLRLSFGQGGTPTNQPGQVVTVQDDSGVPGLSLTSVAMSSAQSGWATGFLENETANGSAGLLLLRYNGVDWSRMEVPGGIGLAAVVATGDDEAWAASDLGTILHYIGGVWSVAYAEQQANSMYFNSLAMISPIEGWAVGGRSDSTSESSLLLHYANGGWTPETIPSFPQTNYLRSVSMTRDGREGWAVGSLYTDTGEVGYALHYVDGRWTEQDGGLSGGASGVYTVGPGDAWLVGNVSGVGPGYIAHFTNGAWQHVASPTPNLLHAICMISPDEGWIAGDGAATLHYANGVWTREGLVIHGVVLSGIAMTAPGEGWAVGGGVLLHDSGGAWSVYKLHL
jgi:hypothetical protein